MGRIGRILFKQLWARPKEFTLVAVNDLMEGENLNYLLKYDTGLGIWKKTANFIDQKLIIDRKEINFSQEKKIKNLDWKKLTIDVIIDATGKINSYKAAKNYLNLGIKKVLITNYSAEIKNLIYGVNHHLLKKEEKIIATGSCTTNCLGLLIKIIQEKYKIKSGFFNTIHAPTSDQKVLDQSYFQNWSKGRSVLNNIIPNSSYASKGLEKIFPELKNKILGLALRVPVITGSILDLILDLTTAPKKATIIQLLKKAENNHLLVTEENLVSSDIIGSQYSAIIPINLLQIIESNKQLRIMAWYDNESSYANQIIQFLKIYGKK